MMLYGKSQTLDEWRTLDRDDRLMVRRDTAIELVLEHERLRLAGLGEAARQLYEHFGGRRYGK